MIEIKEGRVGGQTANVHRASGNWEDGNGWTHYGFEFFRLLAGADSLRESQKVSVENCVADISTMSRPVLLLLLPSLVLGGELPASVEVVNFLEGLGADVGLEQFKFLPISTH